jgi:hypothetical protein|tara:strand:+ start:273 stop:416 length:144 start_codon:yes stop_codon:yes gene_type:complete
MKKKKKLPKIRNWLAIRAFERKGGVHIDRKKEKSRKKCRKKVKIPLD